MKITILGSGTSTGVPQVGCTCPVCTSTDPRDRRLRCSGLVELDGVRVLIDCGPDFREQMLRLGDFGPIDAVLITHEHPKTIQPTAFSNAYHIVLLSIHIPVCHGYHYRG